MPDRRLDIGVVTDEVSRNLEEALRLSSSWGIRRFELREGREARFPNFTAAEVALLEDRLRAGDHVAAVSPGVFKGHIGDKTKLERELEDVLPRSIDLAGRLDCPLIIVFGFEREEGEGATARADVMRAFERAAEMASAAGMAVAIENEPGFWVGMPGETVTLLDEIGHPALKANWDPANAHWGGYITTREDFEALRPHIANVHIKDYYPQDPDAPWRPVGEGETPWEEYLRWVVEETDLPHATLETHCVPLEESSRRSLEAIRRILTSIEEAA